MIYLSKAKKMISPYICALLLLLMPLTFAGCGDESSSDNVASYSDQNNIFEAKMPVILKAINVTSCTLEVSGVGSFNMTVNADDSVSGEIPVPVGSHAFTLTYFSGGSIILARASTTSTISTGSNTITFTSSDLNTSFDDDNDGYTNLNEVKSGTDPTDANSFPAVYIAHLFDPTFSDGFIERVGTDGSNRSVLLSPGGGLRGLVVDEPGNRLFWSDVDSDTINTLNLPPDSGGSTVINTGLLFAQDLEISPSTSKIFWTDASASEIEVANFDGSGRSVILSPVTSTAIAVDEVNQKIYTEDRVTATRGSIVRANFDGTGQQVVVSDVPTATSMAIDPVNQVIYWTSSAGLANGDGGVYRVNFDGTGFAEIFLQGSNLDTGGLALDLANGHIYFGQETAVNRNNIMRMDLDGGNPQIISTGYGNITEMVFVAK